MNPATLITLIKALQEGEKLQNSETWKNQAIIGNIFAALFAAFAPILSELSDLPALEQETLYNYGMNVGFILWSIYNLYVHLATSTTVGLPKRNGLPPTL